MKKVKIIKFRPIKMNFGFDTDRDGVEDCKDCQPFNPKKQHTKKWKQELLKQERFKREHGDEMIWHLKRGFNEEQALRRIKKKPSSNLQKIMSRHQRTTMIPNACAFCGEDIRRTKDVVDYINENKLKDLGSEIRL